ncbi:AAA family ATPase [Arthrobacter sp. Sa2CUA1]|uniref:AAA family ATPase n=1 Tax=Arthrobacter gallicola TaxID=2762225 RepID=A0ABR8UU69_9MICC|nr:LuxR family transcriptional regulator [Arthrobacter gallicola]MBD7996095.1 AAA family ATPase [Arthrobacter gallicola]
MKNHHSEGANALKVHTADIPDPGSAHNQQGNPTLFLGRASAVRSVAERLTAHAGSSGCLLIGPAGSGKSALMRHVLHVHCEDAYVVHIRGSAFAGRTPFGALTFLLSDLEPDTATHPVLILRGLTELIRGRAAGRSIILVVDNAEELDEFSAMVLSQMVLNRAARMIAAFRDFSAAPAEFMGLWRDGMLTRMDLGPLSAAECSQLAEAELEGPISRAAAEDLAGISGGNPSQLIAAVADYRDCGRIRREGEVWVLDPERRPAYPRLAAAMLHAVSGLGQGQHNLLEALALCGTLPLKKVLERAESAEVDALQESGLLELAQAHEPVLSLANPSLGAVLRSQLDTDRRRELMSWLGPDSSTSSPWLSAEWFLSVKGQLPPGLATAGAREANERGNHQAAAAILAGDPAALSSPAALLELVRAHVGAGAFEAAADVLSEHRTLIRSSPVDPAACGLLIIENQVLCRDSVAAPAEAPRAGAGWEGRPALPQPPGPRGHTGVLEEAERLLASLDESTVPRAETAELAAELILARAECHSRHGDYQANMEFLTRIHARGDELGRRLRVLAGAWLCEAWAITGRADDALELAASLWQLMADAPRGTFEDAGGTAAKARIVHALLVSGALRSAAELLAHGPGGTEEAELGGTLRQLCDGLLHAYAGRPAAAAAELIPALCQLSAADPMGLKPAAASAAAYAAAVQGRHERAEQLLKTAAAVSGGTPSWALQRTGRHFAVLAEAALGSPRAVPELLLLADEDDRRQAYSFSLQALLAAVRLGSTGSVERLLDRSCTVQGGFGVLCEDYAKGLGTLDAQLLLQAAAAAGEDGHELLAHETGERALEVASGAGDRATVRFIHRNRRMNSQEGEADSEVEDWLRGLTSRERAIARQAAAGTSNKMIAQELSISVRTVEGHLYQIYSKLHVGSRRELANLVAADKTAREGGQL